MKDYDKACPLSTPPIGPLEEDLIQVMEACEQMLDGITAEGSYELPSDGLTRLLDSYRRAGRKTP